MGVYRCVTNTVKEIEMDNFVYCYLSPFVVGLLLVVAVIVGILGAAAGIIFVGEKIKELYNRSIPYYSVTKKIVRGIGKWTERIIVTLLIAIFTIGVSWIFWQAGLDILKRFACK